MPGRTDETQQASARMEASLPNQAAHNSRTLLLGQPVFYRGADKSLARPTSRCILFDGENISFDASLVIYRVSQEEGTKLREGVPYVKLYRYNPKHLYPKLNVYGDNGKRSLKL